MEDLITGGYDNGNRAFLQAMLAHGTLTLDEARRIVAAIFNTANGADSNVQPDRVSEDELSRYIERASEAASLFDYEIRSIEHQTTKQRIYALVNTTSDPQTQLSTTYNAEELSFIKRVLDAMFDKYNTPRMEVLAITGMQAIKLARPSRRQSQADAEEPQSTQSSTDRGLKHSEVESVLASLVNGGWFEKSRDGFYSLSPRALLELRPWLVEMFNDPDSGPDEWQRIKFCEACKDLVTVGLRCVEPDCTLRLHDICQEAFWRSRRGTNCPKCSKEWKGDHYVGERAATMTEAYQKGRRRHVPGGGGGGGGGDAQVESSSRRTTLAEDSVLQQEQGDETEAGDESDEE